MNAETPCSSSVPSEMRRPRLKRERLGKIKDQVSDINSVTHTTGKWVIVKGKDKFQSELMNLQESASIIYYCLLCSKKLSVLLASDINVKSVK